MRSRPFEGLLRLFLAGIFVVVSARIAPGAVDVSQLPKPTGYVSDLAHVVDPDSKRARIILGGEIPSPIAPPSGCPFHPRCPRAEQPRCGTEAPLLREVVSGHWSACHFAEQLGRNQEKKRLPEIE